jgi:hypothetical protein
LKTLDRRKPFEVVEVTKHTVIVLPLETGNERPIPRAGIENAFRYLVVTGRLTRAEVGEEYTPRSQAYTVAHVGRIPRSKIFLEANKLALVRLNIDI